MLAGGRLCAIGVVWWLVLAVALWGCASTAPAEEAALSTPASSTPADRIRALLAGPQWTTLGADGQRALAEGYLALGNEEAALAHWSAVALVSDDLALWRELAARFQQRGDWSAARQALESILRLSPQDPAAHYALGVLLAPYHARQAYEHLTFAVDDPQFGEGARALRSAIAAAQSGSPAYQSAQVGIALASLEYWPQAEQAFSMAVALNSGYAETWAYLGLARAQQGKEALTAFERALALAPDDPLVVYLHGLMWRAGGDYVRSRLELAEAQRLAPQNPAFAAELGTAYRLEGNYSLAEYWLQMATALAPGELEFLKLLALFYADEGFNLDGSGLAVLQEAVALLPGDADLQAAYAWALFNLQEVTAAQEAIDRALLLAPDNPRALYYLGLMYESRAQTDQAVSTLLRLAAHPHAEGFDVLARRVLARLGHTS